jgi:hypothetical protein
MKVQGAEAQQAVAAAGDWNSAWLARYGASHEARVLRADSRSTATTSSPRWVGTRVASRSPPARTQPSARRSRASTRRRGPRSSTPTPSTTKTPGPGSAKAEVAEIDYTAFTSRAKAHHVTARLIVRRVPDANPAHQSELFTVYRYHAVFTNSPLPTLAAEKTHRGHAIIEQVIADLKNGPLAHLPSGNFWANSASQRGDQPVRPAKPAYPTTTTSPTHTAQNLNDSRTVDPGLAFAL